MVDQEELIKHGKRSYHRNYQRLYRLKKKEQIKKNSDNFYLKQGIHTLQVAPSLNELEKEIDELRCRVY